MISIVLAFARTLSKKRAVLRVVAFVVFGALAGCYDGAQLVAQARNDAIRTRLEEVDLGRYRVTLPRDTTNGERTEVVLHLFGTAPRYRVDDLNDRLEEQGFRIRQAALTALRLSSPEELAEPELDRFRERLTEAANENLDDLSIESIGFYDVQFIRH